MVMNVGNAEGGRSCGGAQERAGDVVAGARGHADAVHGVAREAVVVHAGVLVVEVQDLRVLVAPLKAVASQVPAAATSTRSISSCSDAQPVRTDVLASSTATL